MWKSKKKAFIPRKVEELPIKIKYKDCSLDYVFRYSLRDSKIRGAGQGLFYEGAGLKVGMELPIYGGLLIKNVSFSFILG